MISPDNAGLIDKYIQNNPNSSIPKTITVVLQGTRTDLKSYRLPLDLTFYNIHNGRFASEYIDLKRKENRDLDPHNPEDAKKIQTLLYDLVPKDTLILEKDLQQYGQKEPGIITYDGYVVNGNRRRSVLEELVSRGQSNFNYIEVARLPPNTTSQDIWKIEGGIQLSKNLQLDYGAINELLKFQDGIRAGISPIEIATSLYGGFKEKDILLKLEQLKLIQEYLMFIGEIGIFSRVKKLTDHFIVLRDSISTFKNKGATPDEIVAVKNIGFQLIHDGVDRMGLRKIKDILASDKIKTEFWQAMEFSKPEPAAKKLTKKIEAEQNEEYTPARTIFNNCLDSTKALSESQQPEKLLKRALTNLDNIQEDQNMLQKPEIQSLLSEIEQIIYKLKM
jgi:hypothetical protein